MINNEMNTTTNNKINDDKDVDDNAVDKETIEHANGTAVDYLVIRDKTTKKDIVNRRG